MAVLQPLYFPGGRYSAGTDRKLLAALIPSEADGTRISGVIPSYYGTKSMKVSANGTDRVIAIQPGLCMIPDLSTQSADSPGFYLAAIDASSEAVTLAVNASGSARVDTIYAVVDDTPYTIITKKLTGNVATITTSTAHGFAANQTVVISGVDNTFDGTYTISTVPTTTTFTYSKTHATLNSGNDINVRATAYSANQSTQTTQTYDGTVLSATVTNKALTSNVATLTAASHGFDEGSLVTIKGVDALFDGTYQVIDSQTNTFSYVKIADDVTSVAVTNGYSTSAIARVPFAIKAEQAGGTTLSTKTKIRLATVSVPGSSAAAIPAANVTDYRQYVTGLGGVHIYDTNSSATGPTGVDGRLRWQTNSTGPTGGVRKLEVYDDVDSAWRSLYDTAGNHHDSQTTDASTTAIHHTLGTSATQAAAGNHAHAATNYTSSQTDGTILKNYSSYDSTPNGASKSGVIFTTTSGKILVILTAGLYAGSSTTSYSCQIKTGSTLDSGTIVSAYGGNDETLQLNGSTAGSLQILTRCSVVYYVNLTANTEYNATKFFANSDTTYNQGFLDSTIKIINLP